MSDVSTWEERTLTRKLHWLLLPHASTAVHFTVVCPIGKSEPDGGTLVICGNGAHGSLAVTVKVTTTPLDDRASTTILDGQSIIGGTTSRTRTVKLQLVLPVRLLAVQVTTFVPTGNGNGEVITEPPSV